MARTTKLELSQTLAALGEEVQALRVKCAEQAATIEGLKAAKPNAAPERKVFVRKQYEPSAEQLALRQSMAAAKAKAMTSGRSVLVGA
jgi:peptidoglycan hydrolase CwlO-like protein